MKTETLHNKMLEILIKYYRGKTFTASEACSLCYQIYNNLDQKTAKLRARGILSHLYAQGRVILIAKNGREHIYKLGV